MLKGIEEKTLLSISTETTINTIKNIKKYCVEKDNKMIVEFTEENYNNFNVSGDKGLTSKFNSVAMKTLMKKDLFKYEKVNGAKMLIILIPIDKIDNLVQELETIKDKKKK